MKESSQNKVSAQALRDFARVLESSSVSDKGEIIAMMQHEAKSYDPGPKPPRPEPKPEPDPKSDQEKVDCMVERLEENMRQDMLDTPAGRLATRPLGEYGKSRSRASQETVR